MDSVEEYIHAISALSPSIKRACLNGACYRFHKLLALSYPNALPYMNASRDHVVTCIDSSLYDITGRIGSVNGKAGSCYHLMSDSERRVAEKWSARK